MSFFPLALTENSLISVHRRFNVGEMMVVNSPPAW
jgi:hypothetical protein